VQSLHDTPDIYQATQTKDVPLRKDVRSYLRSRDCIEIIKSPTYTTADIDKKLPAEDLQFLSVCDFHLNRHFTFNLKVTSIAPAVSPEQQLGSPGISGDDHRRPNTAAPKQASNIYSLGQLETHRKNLFWKLNDNVCLLGSYFPI
jgi:hypothetical protein